MDQRNVFVTGGTGYIGQIIIRELLARGHTIHALVRPQSLKRLPSGVIPVIGDALKADTFTEALQHSTAEVLIHLVGTPHPGPQKAAAFRAVDLISIQEAVKAAKVAHIPRLIYISVAQPAPIMRAYIEVRQAGEMLIRESGVHASIIRPWYILGPGHYWPYLLMPLYALFKQIPSMRESAERLGLITWQQMRDVLVHEVEHPAEGIRVLNVPDIKAISAAICFKY